jgi:hypothetical protein
MNDFKIEIWWHNIRRVFKVTALDYKCAYHTLMCHIRWPGTMFSANVVELDATLEPTLKRVYYDTWSTQNGN